MVEDLKMHEFVEQAKNHSKVAVFRAIPKGGFTPIEVYTALQKLYKEPGVLLENLQAANPVSYSYLAFEPIATLTVSDKKNPLKAIRDFQKQNAFGARKEVAHLITSLAGFITYDAIRCFEDIPDSHEAQASLPLLQLKAYRISVTFDNQNHLILISTLIDAQEDTLKAYEKGLETISVILETLTTSKDSTPISPLNKKTQPIQIDVSDAEFIQQVLQAKNHIHEGDAFQIVLSRCFKRPYTVATLDIYKSLCKVSPAPFMFYMPTEYATFIGASPEQLVRVKNNHITVHAIAGTRKRIESSELQAIEQDLLSDTKELAEHRMLVDLARNDVGAVAKPGSVIIEELLKVKHYSHVSHITSTITGTLNTNYDPLDAFAKAFPAGTLSGAPKIRAMQRIDELETSRRGLYGGGICRFDALFNLDSSIAIRMAMLKDGQALVRTGAGVVYDSNPKSEAQETKEKAKAILTAIAYAHGEAHVADY